MVKLVKVKTLQDRLLKEDLSTDVAGELEGLQVRSGLVQFGYRSGTSLVQVWYSSATVLVQVWLGKVPAPALLWLHRSPGCC